MLIESDLKSEGSSLWSINKSIDLINNNLLNEIDFLYIDVNKILSKKYPDQKNKDFFNK